MSRVKPGHKPEISVIIPCYNAMSTLNHALSSLERQTFSGFEVVVVNDGSEDETARVVADFSDEASLDIRFIDQEHAGVSVARNAGLAHSAGKYILFLDSDDVYHRDFILTLYTGITEGNADVAYCYYSRDINAVLNAPVLPCLSAEAVQCSQSEVMQDFMYNKAKMGFSTFIYKRELLNRFQIWFTSETKYGEDLEFAWKYLAHCSRGVKINRALYGYYNNPASAVNAVSWRKTDLLVALKRTAAYLKEMDCAVYQEFNTYMYSRAMWAVAKAFAWGNRKDLYARLHDEYAVKPYMKIAARKAPNHLVRVSALIYCLHQNLFFGLARYLYGHSRRLPGQGAGHGYGGDRL